MNFAPMLVIGRLQAVLALGARRSRQAAAGGCESFPTKECANAPPQAFIWLSPIRVGVGSQPPVPLLPPGMALGAHTTYGSTGTLGLGLPP